METGTPTPSLAAQLDALLREAGATVKIGLRQQGKFDTVLQMRNAGHTWHEIGQAIGWLGDAVRRIFEMEARAEIHELRARPADTPTRAEAEARLTALVTKWRAPQGLMPRGKPDDRGACARQLEAAIAELYGPKAETPRVWSKERDQNEPCACGHPYYRHFDTYEDMWPAGCKYCQCNEFRPVAETPTPGETNHE